MTASGVVSLPGLLIESAASLKALDFLATELKPLVDQKVENAESLFGQVELARGNSAGAMPLLQARVKDLSKPPADQNARMGFPVIADESDYLLARTALTSNDPVASESGETLAALLLKQSNNQGSLMPGLLRRDIAAMFFARR